ncbi:MAG: SDR family oxidoreductase [Vibrio sp.]
MKIENAVIVITSAGTQLGLGLAHHFLSLKAHVILVDYNQNTLINTHQLCQTFAEQTYQYHLDDDSFECIQPLFSSIEQQFENGVDVLINLYPSLPFPSLIHDDFQSYSQNFARLADKILCFSKLAARQMLDNNNHGVIINLACQEIGPSHHSSSLIVDFTQSWASELAPFNIRVGGIMSRKVSASKSSNEKSDECCWRGNCAEIIRNTEYIIQNDYFNGRVLESD